MDVLPDVRQLLIEKKMRPFYLLEKVQGKIIEEELLRRFDDDLSSLKNLNTPEDFKRALDEFNGIKS
ncbi:hypothetical protein EBX93_14850 [bacterium]|nr:hypothetical protein [bacterium]